MKMRKKLAAVLAAAMIASVMPMTAFAGSSNRIDKIVSIEQGDKLTSGHAVNLVIKMTDNDRLASGDVFELKVTDAIWDENVYGTASTPKTIGDFRFTKRTDSTLEVEVINAPGATFSIRLAAEITGEAPMVEVDPVDSLVSAGKYPLVKTATGKAILNVGSVPTIANEDEMATLTFEESFIGAFQNGNTIKIELRDSDFSFTNAGTTTGIRGAIGNGGTNLNADGTLTITLPAGANQRGGVLLEGVKIRPGRNAKAGDIKATISSISGDVIDKQVVTVAKYGDYTTSLKVAKDNYSVVAGQEIDVKFTLSEDMKEAIIANRRTSFEFSKDIVVHNVTVTEKNAGNVTVDYIYDKDDKRTNVFEINDLKPNANRTGAASYEMVATLYVPAGFEGDIALTAEGKAFSETLEAVVAKTEAPVTVEGTGTTLKVGVKKQVTDAKITIKETAKDRLDQKTLTIQLADKDSGIKITKLKAKVTEGDLELNTDKIVYVKDPNGNFTGAVNIPVKRHSTEPSTIEITDIEFNVDRTVPEGSYNVEVSGTALSDLTTMKKGETLATATQKISSKVKTLKEFVVIGTPNTEDLGSGINNAKVAFTVGVENFLIDGKEATMDAAPYIKDGRTMVPVRFVATALGIKADQVIWDQATQTATILADKVIQVKLGSKEMVVNGAVVPMSAAAELKNDRTFVPVAEIARALGVTVAWDADTQTATFN